MAVPPSETESTGNGTFLSQFYSHYLRNRIHALYPYFPRNFFSNFAIRFRSTPRRECLPLPLPSSSFDSPVLVTKRSRVHGIVEGILERVLMNLHSVQKNLQFWQFRAKRSDSEKARFMIFERGPRAFVDETAKLLRGLTAQGSSSRSLCQSASDFIDERVAVLSSLRCSLATFLAQVYMEVDKIGEDLVANPEKELPSLLVTISDLFSTLEASIGHLHAVRESDSSVDGTYSIPLLFEKVPEINQEESQWTDCEIRNAINSIYQNLDKLDAYISLLVIKHRKPRKMTQYWIRYTFGAVGLSVCSIWLLRHSRLVGSSDLDNWILEAKNSTISFFKNHVEQPILSIRDELFETFRKRHQGIMELEEVQLTSNSLHRMLLAFSEQAKGKNIPANASDQEMLEIVMDRYEKELMHPIQNLLNGELVRAILIQVQKLKLDTETAMLELNQILRANEINFAVLTALPAFFLSLLLIMVVRAWFKQDTKAEGRGRLARIQRRLLVAEVKKRIVRYQHYVDQGLKLMKLDVERLVLPAVPSVLETWTGSFGFAKMTDYERSQFLDYTFLDFEGTIMCQKLLMNIASSDSVPLIESERCCFNPSKSGPVCEVHPVEAIDENACAGNNDHHDLRAIDPFRMVKEPDQQCQKGTTSSVCSFDELVERNDDDLYKFVYTRKKMRKSYQGI